MSAVVEFIQNSLSVEWATLLISMLPIVELRVGIPLGIAMGLSWQSAFLIGVVGNMLPIPFVIWLIRPLLNLLQKWKCFSWFVRWQEEKMLKHSKKVARYSMLGLFFFVAIPLPGTGAWTGAMVADFLRMRMWSALISIMCGVLVAAAIITAVSMGFVSGFDWLLN